MPQLKDDFMLDDTEEAEAQSDSTGKAAETETADKADSTAAVADSSDALAIGKTPAEVAMPDDKLEEFFHRLKSTTAAQPAMQHQVVSYMRMAEETIESRAATSACGLAHQQQQYP